MTGDADPEASVDLRLVFRIGLSEHLGHVAECESHPADLVLGGNQSPRGCAFIVRSIGPHQFVVNKELEGISREPPPEPKDSLLDSESVHLDLAYRYFASPLRPKNVEHAMLLQYLQSVNRDAGRSRQSTPVVHDMMLFGITDHQVVVKAEPR